MPHMTLSRRRRLPQQGGEPGGDAVDVELAGDVLGAGGRPPPGAGEVVQRGQHRGGEPGDVAGGTSSAPGPAASGTPPTAKATTGVPATRDSATTRPNDSVRDGWT